MYRFEIEQLGIPVDPQGRHGRDHLGRCPEPQRFGRRRALGGDEVHLLDECTAGVLGAKNNGAPRHVVNHPPAVSAGKPDLRTIALAPDLVQVVVGLLVDLDAADKKKIQVPSLSEIVKLPRGGEGKKGRAPQNDHLRTGRVMGAGQQQCRRRDHR